MIVQLKSQKGQTLNLRVPAAAGLVRAGHHEKVQEEIYVVKRIKADLARKIYDGIGVAWSPKVQHIAQSLCDGEIWEVPVIDAYGRGAALEPMNEAHVLGALLELGVESIPVLIREDLAPSLT